MFKCCIMPVPEHKREDNGNKQGIPGKGKPYAVPVLGMIWQGKKLIDYYAACQAAE